MVDVPQSEAEAAQREAGGIRNAEIAAVHGEARQHA